MKNEKELILLTDPQSLSLRANVAGAEGIETIRLAFGKHAITC